jgi:hypothetical protein
MISFVPHSILSTDFSLFSTSENKTGGAFTLKTLTSNSPLQVNFPDHPPDAVLRFDAHTTNSPALVRLHPLFEGIFKLEGSVFPAGVSPDLDVEDPTGRGRKRDVSVRTVGHGAAVVHGHAAWVPEDPEGAPAGKVEVSTKNSPLHLWL